MQKVSASFSLHATEQSHPEQGKVPNDVQNFVTDKFIGEPQTGLIEHAAPGEHDRVVERTSADEVCSAQGFDFFDKAKRARRSNVAAERAIFQHNPPMLHSNHRMREINEAINFISL